MSGDNKTPSDERKDFDSSRAELFDALGHPTRISILQVLSQRAMTFSELKKELGIESSGHLSFHLGKLGLLVRTTQEGTYELTDDGREALHLVEVMSETGSASTAAGSIRNGRVGRINNGFFGMKSRKSKVLIAASAVTIVVILLLGIGVSNGFVYYRSQATMNWSVDSCNQLCPIGGGTVLFNTTQGKNIAGISLQIGGPPVVSSSLFNGTTQLVSFNIGIFHSKDTHLDSLKIGFVTINPSNCVCTLAGQLSSEGVGGFPPVSSQLYSQNGVETFNVQNFGYVGIATVNIGLDLSLTRLSNLAVYASGNNSVVLNIELKLHSTNSFLIGQEYVGDASVALNIMPNGQVILVNSAST